jgi:hypothetical protein
MIDFHCTIKGFLSPKTTRRRPDGEGHVDEWITLYVRVVCRYDILDMLDSPKRSVCHERRNTKGENASKEKQIEN